MFAEEEESAIWRVLGCADVRHINDKMIISPLLMQIEMWSRAVEPHELLMQLRCRVVEGQPLQKGG